MRSTLASRYRAYGAPSLFAVPLIEHMAQRFPLGLLNDGAPIPCLRFNLGADSFFDERTEIVRIERVQLPAALAVIVDEPAIARVFLLVRCREPRQSA